VLRLLSIQESTTLTPLRCMALVSTLSLIIIITLRIIGKGDSLLGRTIKEKGWAREDLVVSVKMFFGYTPNTRGLSRKKIIEATKASLKRLQLDYCDLVFAHRWETEVPLEETCKAFNWLINKGYALYWGTSAWPEEMITEAIKLCDAKGWHRPIADQCEYNCLVRENVETSYIRLFEKYGLGSTVWSPLGGGMLTGKYNDGEIPEDSRFAVNEMFKNFSWDKYIGGDKREKTLALLKGLKETAEELGVSQAELALAWILVNKDVSTCIIGASKISQIESNLRSVELATKWNQEIEDKLSGILANEPPAGVNWLNWAPLEGRRKQRLNLDMKLGCVEYKSADQADFD
jgi:aryl-alcohol dehydrogenase-like predicted oxidoreductase